MGPERTTTRLGTVLGIRGWALEHRTLGGIVRTRSLVTDGTIRNYLASLFNAGAIPAYSNVIYGVYLPPGMRVFLQGGVSCSSFCGYHGSFSYGGPDGRFGASRTGHVHQGQDLLADEGVR